MARMNAAERAEFEKRERERQEADRKARAPTIGGSIKEGAREALSGAMRLAAGGGLADRARAAERQETRTTKRKIEDIDAP